jgi:Ala-tRNA(Pro) deacylase
MPATPDELARFLATLGIAAETIDHPPVYTVEEARSVRGQISGGHTKNLFLKDKKDSLFLLVALEDAIIDLKRVHTLIGAQGRLSFGSAALLERVWGVKPGSVTPFGAINDEGRLVKVVLERTMMTLARLNFHPLVNTRTTSLASSDLIHFLRSTGHAPEIVNFAVLE